MSMHSEWERGAAFSRDAVLGPAGDALKLTGATPLPSLGTSVVSALSWPVTAEARLVTRKERSELRARAEKAGLLWVSVPAPSAQQRGQLALVVDAAIEEQLAGRAAGPAGFGAATNLEATLSDQLYRARSVGATGLVLMFDTLARLTNLAGALDAEDSAVLRWWLRAATEKRVRLLFDVRDRYLGIYTRPVALETLLVDSPVGIQLEADTEEESEQLSDWLDDDGQYSPADLARALHDASPPPPPSRLSAPPPPPPRAGVAPAALAEETSALEADVESTESELEEPSPQLELGLDASPAEAQAAAPEGEPETRLEPSEAALGLAEAAASQPEPPAADAAHASDEVDPSDEIAANAGDQVSSELPPAAHDVAAPIAALAEAPQDSPAEIEGGARQLAFRSVLAALEAIEHEELDESPMLPESDWQAADEATAEAAAQADAEDVAFGGESEPDEAPAPIAVPEPSPLSDGFTAMLTQEESPLPTRAIHYDSSAPSASFEASDYHQDAMDRSSRAPEVAPIDPPFSSDEEAPLVSADAEVESDLATDIVNEEAESQHTVVEAPVAAVEGERLALVPSESEAVAAPSLEVLEGDLDTSAPLPEAEAAALEPEPAESSECEFDPVPDATWQAWVRDLEAARGPKPLAVVERLFTSAYMPLVETRLGQPLNAQADAAIESWGTAFAKSYSEAFDALRIRGKRPTMVLDVPDIALRHGRMHGARQAQLLLVDGLRFDLGQMVHEHLKELAGRDAACVERLLLWSALPANTATQLELLGRGPQGLREPVASERDAPVARGRAASTLRRVRAGHRDVMKLDLVESRITEPGAARPGALWSLAAEVAEVLWAHMAGLPPRTLVMIFGDHGFRVDPKNGRVSHSPGQGLASPEEVMVPAFAWLTGSVH
ncbi:MAG: hypothetical protein H6716_02670 [Polyangiaceae bacterium]|nr:hypothetical protein [Polyangiaceae bacterium]